MPQYTSEQAQQLKQLAAEHQEQEKADALASKPVPTVERHESWRIQIGGNGERESLEPRSRVYDPNADRDPAQGILSTARSSYGGRVVGAIKDSDRVLIGHLETNVATAVTLGYLRKNPDGSYVEVDKPGKR